MPIDVTINQEDQIVHAVCRGDITLSDIQNYQQEVWNLVDSQGYKELFDASRGDLSDINLEDFIGITKNRKKYGLTDVKKAIVISSQKQLQYAITNGATCGLKSTSASSVKTFFLSSIALDWLKNAE